MTRTKIHDIFDQMENYGLSLDGIYNRLSDAHEVILLPESINYFQCHKDSFHDRIVQIYYFMRYVEALPILPYEIGRHIENRDVAINNAILNLKDWLRDFTPGVSYSPYVRQFYQTSIAFSEDIDSRNFPLTKYSDKEQAKMVNRYVLTLKEAMQSRAFKETIRKQESQFRRQFVSACQYVDGLFCSCRRMVVLRMDFSLDPKSLYGHDDSLSTLLEYFVELKGEMKLRSGVFEHMVGYIARVEFSVRKRHHIHAVLLFNGDRVWKASNLSRLIAERWQHITQGTGIYFNTHAKFNQYACPAIGMIYRDDREKRQCLTYVLWYITKQDQFVPYKHEEKQRLFFRGELPVR
ncbi:inovirus-type Gp2 protein [Acidithiobacillus sp. AMEEHan]|uniref:YagK/YfjJ domain-containing protein n=1 Tax=Acidithiobacillus sp. AMEEHan TaxID=2994951 RepID=UPI0027E46C7C|nr:inovirus-type Gp2 protein [Acidithiobacillus sp. AMEEHan]